MGGIAGNLKDLALQEEEHAALERDLELQLVSSSFFLGIDSAPLPFNFAL